MPEPAPPTREAADAVGTEARSAGSGTATVVRGGDDVHFADSTLTGNSGESFRSAPYRDIFFKGRALDVSSGTVE